ncbi:MULTISPECIES: ATPase domain-containing protein [unclassified Bradyrhizobium]|uniref:ATPase domain-containing protein n=1 Tax=unclassified Bradyrhizobium TaxID=2631580 RepID=UPI00247A7B49|nr:MULTISPECIES: ATPase domain-containing protein [unclassified Bradyrhizobium]WGS21718.1 AAA family ATPase [Bradyrhizobium sp. ISRA463]WGS28667.1 AAA family ATPase [Bradyrhizobium sp. ISRA464]
MITQEEAVEVSDVLDRVKTGVNAFDELVMGGLPRGRTTVVGGTPGSGKTVFATQFLAHGITHYGENGVLVTFEEPPTDIEANMRGFGWDLPAWRKEGRLAFVDASPSASDELVVGDYDLAGLLARIDHAVKTVRARRVVLDSLTQLFDHFIGDPKILRRELFRISSALKKSKLAVLMTAERNNEYGEITRHRLEEFVADNVVILRNVLHREKRRRTIEVLKMRGSHHAEGEAPFTLLENKGVVAVPLSSLRLERNRAWSG